MQFRYFIDRVEANNIYVYVDYVEYTTHEQTLYPDELAVQATFHRIMESLSSIIDGNVHLYEEEHGKVIGFKRYQFHLGFAAAAMRILLPHAQYWLRDKTLYENEQPHTQGVSHV